MNKLMINDNTYYPGQDDFMTVPGGIVALARILSPASAVGAPSALMSCWKMIRLLCFASSVIISVNSAFMSKMRLVS